MSTVDETRWTEVIGDDRHLPLPVDLGTRLSDTTPENDRGAEVVRLAGRFVEQLVHDAIDARRRSDPSAPVPVVDWDALWSIGAKSATMEQAVGRVVVAAEGLACDIARGRLTPGLPGGGQRRGSFDGPSG